jgi:hypothetical protein
MSADKSNHASGAPKPDPIKIDDAFGGLCIMRNGEAQSRWETAQLGILLNVPALAAALFRLSQWPTGTEVYLFILGSMVLIATNIFWHSILGRRESFLEYWNQKLEELERRHGIEGGVMIFSSTDYLRMRHAGVRFYGGLQWIAWVCIGLWAAIGAGAVAMALVVQR